MIRVGITIRQLVEQAPESGWGLSTGDARAGNYQGRNGTWH
jgi:hypothetical protein